MEDSVERSLILTDLPYNVQIEIFKYLTLEELVQSVRLTCKLWHQLSHEHIFWKTLDDSLFRWISFSTSSFMKLLAQTCDSVETVKVNVEKLLQFCFAHTDGIVCPNLKALSIKPPFSMLSKGHLKSMLALSDQYPNLKTFRICGPAIFRKLSSMTGEVICQDQMTMFASLFPNVETFYIGDENDHTTHEDLGIIESFIKAHSRLKQVGITNFDLRSETISMLMEEMPQLEELWLDNCDCKVMSEVLCDGDDNPEGVYKLPNLSLLHLDCVVTDIITRKIIGSTKILEKLDLSGVRSMSNLSLEAIGQYCPKLTHLNLDYCLSVSPPSFTDAGIERVVENCHRLTVLNVNNCVELTDRSIEAVANNCPSLEELHVNNIVSLSDYAIIAIAERCPLLSFIDVSSNSKLTGLSMSKLLKNCKHLRAIQANSCHRVSDIRVIEIQEKCLLDSDCNNEFEQESGVDGELCRNEILESLSCHSHLRDLQLDFCINLTNASISQISVWCKDLSILSIMACPYVTDAGIMTLVRGCRYLRNLNISGGSISQRSRLTDRSLMEIAEHCDHLEELYIHQINNLTSNAVAKVLHGCQKLCKLLVGTQHGVTQTSLVHILGELKNRTTSLKILPNNSALIKIYRNKELDILTGK